MKRINKNISALIITLSTLTASSAFATAPQNAGGLPQNAGDMIALMWRIVDWVFVFFIVTAVIYLMIASFSYLTAEGDAEKISKAKHELIYAIIAVAIASLSRAIVYAVASIIGAKL